MRSGGPDRLPENLLPPGRARQPEHLGRPDPGTVLVFEFEDRAAIGANHIAFEGAELADLSDKTPTIVIAVEPLAIAFQEGDIAGLGGDRRFRNRLYNSKTQPFLSDRIWPIGL